MLHFIRDDKVVGQILMNSDRSQKFIEKSIHLTLTDRLISERISADFDHELEPYISTFICSGVIAVIRRWTAGNFREPPEQMEQMLLNLVMNAAAHKKETA